MRWMTRLSQRCMGTFILRSIERGAYLPTSDSILEGTSLFNCSSGCNVAVLQHVLYQCSDLVSGDGGAIAQARLHRLVLQMIQGCVHQDAGLQQLLLHFGKTDPSFLAKGVRAGAFCFANQRFGCSWRRSDCSCRGDAAVGMVTGPWSGKKESIGLADVHAPIVSLLSRAWLNSSPAAAENRLRVGQRPSAEASCCRKRV